MSDDGITPSSCTVHLGDTDPLTGERLTDLEFFLAYHRDADREIHRNLRCMRPEYTREQRERRREEARAYREAFRKEYGYSPSRDDILRHLEELEQPRYCLHYDGLISPDGDALTEYMPEFGRSDRDPFGADLPDDVYALREVADTLTGRKRDVYEAMLVNLAGGTRITNTELAKRWGVCESCIRQDQGQIRRMIRKKLGR